MPAVEVHAVVHKRVHGPLVWYEGAIRLVEIDGDRQPEFTFGVLQLGNGELFYNFPHDNVVLCWLMKNEQIRGWHVLQFLTSYARQLINALKQCGDGANASHAWCCDAGSDEDIATLEDALNCVPIAHILPFRPRTAEA
jgi:hypothetical protein